MPARDRPLLRPGDIAAALALLTRLPAPPAPRHGAVTAWAWPVAGALVALAAGLLGLFAEALGLAPPLAAGLALAALVTLTGALHEDGLADTVDGFWGGADPARRLEIMRDSRIGSYGVIALVLSLGLRWAALAALLAAGGFVGALVAAAALSRAAMAAAMHGLPAARATGLAAATGRPARDTVLASLAAALILSAVMVGASALTALLAAGLAALAVALVARAKIGGQTGDVLGAVQQAAEVAVLVALTV